MIKSILIYIIKLIILKIIMVLQYNQKKCLKEILSTLFYTSLLSSFWFMVFEFNLYTLFNSVLFGFYICLLCVYSLINLINIYETYIYLSNYRNILDERCLNIIRTNNCFYRNKIKGLLFSLAYILSIILAITFFGSETYKLFPFYMIFPIIILSSIPFIILFICIILVVFNISSNIYITAIHIRNSINSHNTNVNITRERRTNNLNYNINVVLPLNQVASQEISNISQTQNNNTCSICLEEDKNNEWCSLVCKHTYHISCINKWLYENSTCPLCRQEVLNLV